MIANPIYDTVFKYLMDDPRVAGVIISTIIGEEVEELVFSGCRWAIDGKWADHGDSWGMICFEPP